MFATKSVSVNEIESFSLTKRENPIKMCANMQQKSAQFRSSYSQLRRQLMHGQLTPGSRLVEEKWAELLDVNRSALRQSLLILAHEGLLTIGAAGGYFVPVADQRSYDEALEVRLALETGALQVMALSGGVPAEGLARLRSACELMQQQMESSLEYGFAEADRKFHDMLVELAGNRKLLRVYLQSPLPISPCRDADAETRQANMRKTIREHVELCDLLESGRISEAMERLQSHLLHTHGGTAGLVAANSETDSPGINGRAELMKETKSKNLSISEMSYQRS